MSELMTTEAIIEAEWILKGFWTRPRYSFVTERGGWSDVDIVSYKPEKKHLVISESKAQNKRNRLYAYTSTSRTNFFEFDGGHYLSFLRNIPRLLQDKVLFCFKDETGQGKLEDYVEQITVQLGCNFIVEERIKDEVVKYVSAAIQELISHITPAVKIDCHFQLDTTIDIFARVIALERADARGRRYGNQIIDTARELNRHFSPNIEGANSAEKEQLRIEGLATFLGAINPENDIIRHGLPTRSA